MDLEKFRETLLAKFERIKNDHKHSRGFIQALQMLVMGLVSIAITIGMAFVVLTQFFNSLPANSAAANNVAAVMGVLGTVVTWLAMLVLVFIAILILGYFGVIGGGGRGRGGGRRR